MYGQIHCVIRELVEQKFGEDTWREILAKSELDPHEHFMVFTRYDDSLTFKLVGAVSEHLDLPLNTVLQVFGGFFFTYCLRHGYDKMLKTLGGDIVSFIQNLDSLHALLALSYKGINAPSFRCEYQDDGTLILHYYSTRPGLHPIVIGLVEAVGRDLFHQSVTLTVLQQSREETGVGRVQEHTAFKVDLQELAPAPTPEEQKPEALAVATVNGGKQDSCVQCSVGTMCRASPDGQEDHDSFAGWSDSLVVKARDFCTAFPYHILFDEHLLVRQCGIKVRRLCHGTVTEGSPLSEVCDIVHPVMHMTLENIFKFINAVFLISLRRKECEKPFLLKGQMVWMSSSRSMIFIGSPRLTSLNELMEMNVYLADIPLYDVTRELVLLNQQRIAEIDVAKKLDETTAELKKTSRALEEEKQKTETLLYQMLPKKVARQLTQGLTVEAEKFDSVTILFSDIVTFTNIASACQPMDIVNMLNDLYHRFDSHTTTHDVYKVETIGDAYMVVGGVPVKQEDHAERVASFAVDMVEDSGNVMSPATGKPLQIRVGIHTGPVVAGVVGKKMPRYCLFGDTVNTASRMESHGIPGRIHLSHTTHRELHPRGYVFKRRGLIEVKGKGKMTTYFLVGSRLRSVRQPTDEFLQLPDESLDDNPGDVADSTHQIPSSESSAEPNKHNDVVATSSAPATSASTSSPTAAIEAPPTTSDVNGVTQQGLHVTPSPSTLGSINNNESEKNSPIGSHVKPEVTSLHVTNDIEHVKPDKTSSLSLDDAVSTSTQAVVSSLLAQYDGNKRGKGKKKVKIVGHSQSKTCQLL